MPNTPTSPVLVSFDIPKGWNALFDPAAKKVYVLKEFPLGGKAKSALSLLNKPTEAELRAEIAALGLTILQPAAPNGQA